MLLEDAFENILGVSLGIVEVNPVLLRQSNAGGIFFDLGPICRMPHVASCFACLLDCFDALISVTEI